MMTNEAAERLLGELQENPLPGARHAYSIVRDRLPAILAAERSAGAAPIDVARLALALHEVTSAESTVDCGGRCISEACRVGAEYDRLLDAAAEVLA